MNITTVLPISRLTYLDRVIDSLLAQTLKPNNLLVVFDGHDSQFLEVRNKIVGLPFNSVICIPSTNTAPAHTIQDRRRHISKIHNQFRELVQDADWIFSIEDDGILPSNALERLVELVSTHDNVGMATGVELGRWGVPYVGAWRANNIGEPTEINSIEMSESSIEEIDACGLYCALIRADKYKEHVFFYNNGLGPDVNLGIYLRQQGFNNYIDWSIPVTHLTLIDGKESEIHPSQKSRAVKLRFLYGDVWQASH